MFDNIPHSVFKYMKIRKTCCASYFPVSDEFNLKHYMAIIIILIIRYLLIVRYYCTYTYIIALLVMKVLL